MDGAFWRERLETVLTRTIPSQHVRLEEYGILEFAEAAAAAAAAPHPGRQPRHVDPGVLGLRRRQMDRGGELCAVAPARREIEAQIDAIVDDLAKAQAPDGYLNCWYLGREPDKRWTNLRDRHELYCAGHHARRRDRLLPGDRAPAAPRRHAPLCRPHRQRASGPGRDQKHGYCGHQEIELALVKLYRRDRRPEAPRPRRLFHQRARAHSRTISTSRRSPAATTRRSTGSRPTNTASRTCRCASRTRSSAMRCAPCTCTRRWPTSPPSSATRR